MEEDFDYNRVQGSSGKTSAKLEQELVQTIANLRKACHENWILQRTNASLSQRLTRRDENSGEKGLINKRRLSELCKKRRSKSFNNFAIENVSPTLSAVSPVSSSGASPKIVKLPPHLSIITNRDDLAKGLSSLSLSPPHSSDSLQKHGRDGLITTSDLLSIIREMETKLLSEIEKREKMVLDRVNFESEMSELSQSLFEEANAMVCEEKKRNAELEKKLEGAKKRIVELEEILHINKTELTFLKESLSKTVLDDDNGQEVKVKELVAHPNMPDDKSISNSDLIEMYMLWDRRCYESFETFYSEKPLLSVNKSHHMDARSSSVSTILGGTDFFKYYVTSDVENVLFCKYGSNSVTLPKPSRSSTSSFFIGSNFTLTSSMGTVSSSSSSSSQLTKKKKALAVAMINGNFAIESTSLESIEDNERSCFFCGNLHRPNLNPLSYRATCMEDYSHLYDSPMCYLCRERILPLCELLCFLRQIALGLWHDSVLKSFQRYLLLKKELYVKHIILSPPPKK